MAPPAGPRRAAHAAHRARALAVLLVGLFIGAAAAALPVVAGAQDHDAGRAHDGGAASEAGIDAADPEAVDPAVAALLVQARAVRDLVGGHLAIEVDSRSLFDVPVEDDGAMDLEAARLGALLRDVAAQAQAADAAAHRTKNPRTAARDAGRPDTGLTDVAPALWEARLELDRARLAFYALPSARRRELLALVAAQRAEAGAPTEAEQREREAAEQREKALQAIRAARSEGERLVSEEYARLLDVERTQTAFEKELGVQRDEIAGRRELTLGWQRRARDARAPTVAPATVDATYDAVRKSLRVSRDALDSALAELSRNESRVPRAGADPLAELRTTVDITTAREERRKVEAGAARLAAEEESVQKERASQLLDEIDTLNGERLALLPFLSSDKRSAITGFTAAGADQAASEVRQLTLIARYHRYAFITWLVSMRHPRQAIGMSVGGAVLVAIEWLVVFAAFLWTRRRSPLWLQHLRKRAQESDRRERLATPSLATRAAVFALLVHRPIEWFGLALFLSWLLPDSAKGLLEIQLLTVIVNWVLGGALVVVVVNALAGAQQRATRPEGDTPALRLRSLKLVGWVVVTFGLLLVLTSRLVGPGTIYQWVWSTCWIASLPVVLVLVRWWRDVVFARAERSRKKTAFEQWVLANRVGWKSFLAATAGGVYLFGRGAYRATRSWIGRFNVTRRALAYLFRRELGKLEAERTELVTARISDAAFDALGPNVRSDEWLPSDIDEEIEALTKRLQDRRGGVIALVGSRGMGKTAILRRLHAAMPDTLLISAPAEGGDALREVLCGHLSLPPQTSIDDTASALCSSPLGRALLIDDGHRFVRPVMGGLATFDALLAAASRNSSKTTWIIALDEVIWLFLQRARGARPLFDEVVRLRPWREEQIIELLRARTERAGLAPSFERLLEKLPSNADEIDKQEALASRAGNYYRLLWDYAAGNPGVALHMWRRSLGADADGQTHVRFFQAPDTADLEVLPDPAIFVLRAVLQLSPATAASIGKATMLSGAEIADALRYAKARGYVDEVDGRFVITWTWLRALTLFLQRRHLLVTP